MGNSRLSKYMEVVPCKWVLKLKRNSNVNAMKFSARLVVWWNLDDADLGCTFASVVDFTPIRLMLSITVQAKWEVHQNDYSKAFVQSALDWEVYLMVSKHINSSRTNKLCRLQKILYGLRQSAHMVQNVVQYLDTNWAGPWKHLHTCFDGHHVTVLCFVHDLLIMVDDKKEIKKLKN